MTLVEHAKGVLPDVTEDATSSMVPHSLLKIRFRTLATAAVLFGCWLGLQLVPIAAHATRHCGLPTCIPFAGHGFPLDSVPDPSDLVYTRTAFDQLTCWREK